MVTKIVSLKSTEDVICGLEPIRVEGQVVGYELFDATRNALIDGTLTMAISHPLDTFAKETISALIRAKNAGPAAGAQNVTLGFEIYTSENV